MSDSHGLRQVDMRRALVVLGWIVWASCAGAQRSAADPPVARTDETEECRSGRVRILADAERSRQRRCVLDTDCQTATNPGSASPRDALAVSVQDFDTLDGRAREHLGHCGAYLLRDREAQAPDVEARCFAGTCDVHILRTEGTREP